MCQLIRVLLRLTDLHCGKLEQKAEADPCDLACCPAWLSRGMTDSEALPESKDSTAVEVSKPAPERVPHSAPQNRKYNESDTRDDDRQHERKHAAALAALVRTN